MKLRKVSQAFVISGSRSAAFLISVSNRNNPQGMNPNELLRIVDSLHRDKNIQPELVFQAIESALVSAAKRQYGETAEIMVSIARDDGTLTASCDGQPMDQEEIGRIGAQTAKQVIIQKIREAERDSLVQEYSEQMNQIVNGIIQRNEGAAAIVSLGSVEAILPRSEQIPGESHHPNERIRALIFDVRPQGTRVKVVLSRTRPKLVQLLFEQEIPEIQEGVITIHAVAREPGYRSKIAVSSMDPRVDCVGACVGVRGNRIKNIVDELGGTERIDIVRWEDNPEQLIANALQPAEVDQVLLCDMIGRAIVLVREDQLSLAIGRRGQNVRLASKLCGWDIELYTAEELEEQIDRAVTAYASLDGVDEGLAQRLVEQGYLSYDDLSVIEPDAFMELGELTAEQVDTIVTQAEEKAEEAEKAAAEQRRLQKEQALAAKLAAATEEAATEEAATEEATTEEATTEEATTEEAEPNPETES
jgi:N utilization substance protein A